MILVDANLLIYAVDRTAPQHHRAAAWLEDQLDGSARVGIPWESLTAFIRIATHPRVMANRLSAAQTWGFVHDWLDAPVT